MHAPSVMSHGVPATVTGGGGGAGCGSGVFVVVSTGGAGAGSGAGSGETDVGATEDGGADIEEEDAGSDDGDEAGPDASDVPHAVARKAITTKAALRIAHPPGIMLFCPWRRLADPAGCHRPVTNWADPGTREGRPTRRWDGPVDRGARAARPRPRTG